MSESSAIDPPAQPVDHQSTDPAIARPERPSSDELWTRASTLALLGGFGLGALAGAVGEAVAWPVAAIAVGMLFRRNWVAGALGLILAAIGLAVALAPTAPSPPAEGFGYVDSVVRPIAIMLLVIIGPLLAYLGHRLGSGGRTAEVGGAVAALGGLIAVVLVSATAAAMFVTPGRASFEVAVPTGWHAVGPADQLPMDDPGLGMQYTSVRGDAVDVAANIATTATIGVSVFDLEPSNRCPYDTQGWGGSNSVVYRGTLVSQAVVILPAGTASHETRTMDPPGSTIDIFGFSRVRRVGLAAESLCYILAIRSPAGAPVDPAEVAAIAEGIRFR